MPAAGVLVTHRKGAAPFRSFFLLAALDAMLGGMVWTPPGQALAGLTEIMPGEWHRNILLFGTVPAILAGFLLTALPRWTKQRAVSPIVIRSLAGVWLIGRMVFLIAGQAAGLAFFGGFVLFLIVVLGKAVVAGRDRRNLKILLLLAAYCSAIMLTAGDWQPQVALRLALAAVLGLVMVIGGRVVPALTEAYLQKTGGLVQGAPSVLVERLSALFASCALAAWVVAPLAQVTGVACALAAISQAVRLAQWRGWRTRASAAILVLHIGYGWIVAGFALLAAHAIAPSLIGRAGAVHAWTVGAVGTMALGIMASMARKHAGRAFASSWQATAAFLAVFASALARLLAEAEPNPAWLPLSGSLWIAAFALFFTALLRMRPVGSALKSSEGAGRPKRMGAEGSFEPFRRVGAPDQ